MYNKKVLSKAVSNLGSAKAPAKKRDKIYTNKEALSPFVSSEGYKQGPPPPGTNYRIQGDTLYNPTRYPIEAVSDNGIRKRLKPYDTENTYFPGATHVDEYEDYYDDELTDDEIEELRRGGYVVEELSDEEYKKGGEKKYSRSLSAKNRLFVENKLTKKPKSRKKKIFDPKAKYFQDGGVQCDDDGRCYETDQAQELLDKTHQTVTNALKIDQNVLDATSQGYPANEVWQDYGVKTADQLTGDPYAFACANSATRGYAICDPNVKDTATLSNDRMKNAVAQGTTPFRKVGTYRGNQYKDVVKPGNLVSFMDGHFKHMVKNIGSNKYAQSTGSVEDWNDDVGVNWIPGNIPATVYEYAPYYNQIQALEEQARVNPTYVPGTASVGTLPIRPAEAIAIQEAERVLPAVNQDLGSRQFGGIPTLPLNQNRQVLRDWLYGKSIGMLQEDNGGYMDLELSDEKIEAYRHGGYHVEEY